VNNGGKSVKITNSLAALATVALVAPAFAYVPPTDDQIERILADHSEMNALLVGASPAQAAETVVRALAELEASTIPAASKQQNTVLLYVRALLLSGENAPEMVGNLAGQIGSDLLTVLAAATAVAVGASDGPVFAALQNAAGATDLSGAAADPVSVLGEDLVALIQQLVIDLRGVAAPVIPPPPTAAMTLVPPIVPRGEGGLTPPPVASAYANQ
jgi:hypothetical protein